MMALVEAARAPDFPAEIALVMSNNEDAQGLSWAKERGIQTAFVSHKGKTKPEFEAEMQHMLNEHHVQIVALAGFMRLLSTEFTKVWEGKMINIHPSLLPEFKGLDTHKRALEAGAKTHGCSVHYVSAAMDEGEIIAQSSLDVLPHENEASLAARVLKLEHALYPSALRHVCLG